MIIDALEFDRARMGRKLDAAETRRLQLEMLDALTNYCDAHGLTYYLSGGTLLGAVRHQGFIPWDDDVDVNMPRPDYEKLKALTGCHLNDHLEISSPEGPIEHSTSFARLCDTRYVTLMHGPSEGTSYYANLFIDIFAIEGQPSSMRRCAWRYRLSSFLISMRRLAYFKGISGGQHAMVKRLLRPVARLFGYRFWNRRLYRLATRYRYEDTEKVGVVMVYEKKMEEIMPREGYGKPVKVTFEGRQVNAPADADRYLRNLYGDYMKLPPEDQRVAHHIEIWEIKGGTA